MVAKLYQGSVKQMLYSQEDQEMSTEDKLRRALEPFANLFGTIDDHSDVLDSAKWFQHDSWEITYGDIRRAREALAATQEQPDNYNSKLADDLQRRCCAETEGKFFDCVTDNIQTIIAALRSATPARFDGEQALAEWEGKHGGGK